MNHRISYAQALGAVAQARAIKIVLEVNKQPDLLVDEITQTKLATVVATMLNVGRLPGDIPLAEFDKPVTYQYLGEKTQQWLEAWGVPARDFTPLASKKYAWLFGNNDRLPVSREDADSFFNFLIHCLLIELQIIVAKQYFHGLGLYRRDVSFSLLSEVLPANVIEGALLSRLNQVEIDQLHGRIFLEYCAIMVRAQWDKLTLLVCQVLNTSKNWKTVSKGLKAIEHKLDKDSGLNQWCEHHFRVFLRIAKQRLENGWLKDFRDPLLHKVGRHSAGVIPQRQSLETTSEMWDKVREEHNALREAMLAMLASFLSIRAQKPDRSSEEG